jgi:hypothetical protein
MEGMHHFQDTMVYTFSTVVNCLLRKKLVFIIFQQVANLMFKIAENEKLKIEEPHPASPW